MRSVVWRENDTGISIRIIYIARREKGRLAGGGNGELRERGAPAEAIKIVVGTEMAGMA